MTISKKLLVPSLFVALLALSSCATGAFKAGAAVVNGQLISTDEVEKAVKQQSPQAGSGAPEGEVEAARRVLLNLIQKTLLTQEAAKRRISATPAEVDEQLATLREQFGGEEALQLQIRQQGFTIAEVRELLADRVIANKLAKALATPITDAQVREAYEQQQDTYREVKTRHILALVDQENSEAQAQKRIADAKAALERGDSFAAVAKRYSQDPGSKDSGGALDFTPVARLDPAYGRAAYEARVGQLIGPVRSQFGLHLIITDGKRTKTFEEAAPEIRRQLEQQDADRLLGDFLQERMQSAKIQINPKYGDWDPATGTIVPHRGFVPASPETSPDPATGPGGFPVQTGSPGP